MPSRNKSVKRTVEADQHVKNAAKTLLANIRFMSPDKPYRVLLFTSSVPSEGKTFVVSNLGEAIATSGKSCLIIECDMRRRSMANVLGTHAQRGVYAVMSGQAQLSQAAVRTSVRGLYFLDAEPHIPNPSDILGSRHFQTVLDAARQAFDYVLLDTPPVGAFVDAAVLGTKADATFIVVRENFVRRDEVKAAVEQLQASGSNVAGVVMNFCERKGSGYYDYYYEHGDNQADSEAPQYVEAPQQPQAVPNYRPPRQSQQRSAAQQAQGQQAKPAGAANASSNAAVAVPPVPAAPPRRANARHTVAPMDTAAYERIALEEQQRRSAKR